MKSKLFKKVVAAVSAVSMLASMAFVIPASAAWEAPQYGADVATYSGTKMKVTERGSTIGGEAVTFGTLGYVGGGIADATPGDGGGAASFNVNVDAEGDYDVVVTVFNPNKRRVDIQVGEDVYAFPGETEDEYMAAWTLLSEDEKPVATYTFEDVAFASGANTVLVGTKINGTWAPDLVGIDVTVASDDEPEVGATNAPAPDASEAPEVDATNAPDADEAGIVFADGNVTVKAEDIEKAVLIYALYDGNALESVELYPITFTDGVATQALPDAVNGARLMVWNALVPEGDEGSGLVPIEKVDPVVVTGGIEPTPKPTVEPTAAPTPDVEETAAPTAEPTPEPTPTPTPKPTIDPNLIYYTYDHEGDVSIDAKGNSWNSTLETWVSYYDASAQSVQIDSNPDINKYFQFKNDTTSGTRSAYFIMPEAAGTLDENQQSVIEFDFKLATTGADSELVIVGNPTPSANNTVGNDFYKGDNYILKLRQSNSLNGFYVNDNQTVMSTGYPNAGAWAHAKAVLSYESKSVLVTITSLDGATTYLDTTQVPMGSTAGAPRILFVAGGRSGGAEESIDNFMSRKVMDGDIVGTYYTATFVVESKETKLSAKDGEKIDAAGIPDTTKTGYIFDGWAKDDDTENLLTTEQVANTPLTADVTYTAVYHKNAEYIEPMTKVEFTKFPENGLPTMGESADVFESNPIQIKLTGEIGSVLIGEDGKPADDRVKYFDVDWEFDGFRTLVSDGGRDTDEVDDNGYCDSYAKTVYNENDPTKVDFQLKKVSFNFYGQVKATVKYGVSEEDYDEITITRPMAIIPNKTPVANQILPKPGYVADFTPYADEMVGYKATTSGDNKDATDIVTGDWAAYGGNNGRGLYIASEGEGESAKKFLKLKSTGTNSSSFAVNKLSAAPTGQFVISQDVRFYNVTDIMFKHENPVSWGANATTTNLKFTGTAIVMNDNNGTKITDATTGIWYHIVISGDVTSGLWYAKVYNADGTKLLGESDPEPFVNAGATSPIYLCYRTPDNSQGEVDFNNVKMYVPEIDGELSTTIDNNVLSIPGKDTPADAITSANLTVKALSTEGYEMIGKAEWSVVNANNEEAAGITITPDATDTHKAVLKVGATAEGGDYKVVVSLGGKQKEIPITVSASTDSVVFTEQVRSISIPMTENNTATATYKAHVIDKNNAELANGANVTYKLYDKNNTNELTTPPEGVTFATDDTAHTATLTVDYTASATVVYIRATGQNSDGENISRSVRVDIHGLSFDFGTDTAAEGYTAVTAATAYSETAGYGIVSGTPTASGEGSAENADSDSLKGAFKFQVKVEPNKVYDVTINHVGGISYEGVTGNVDLAGGISKSNETKGAVTYPIAVIGDDGILDISFAANAEVSSIIVDKQADKLPGGKPYVFTVGDSTISNNGSWGYTLSNNLSRYPELANIISAVGNNGQGSQNLKSYYTGGQLMDRVLVNIKPGDYVTIGNMGTNGMDSNFEASFNYYVDACLAMGAKVILNSYSPHGSTGSDTTWYDATNHIFKGVRTDGYDVIVRKIYTERATEGGEKYNPNVIGFIDIGQMADDAFNAYIRDWENVTAWHDGEFGKNYTSIEDAVAELRDGSFSDHNHYGDAKYGKSKLASWLMLEGYKAYDDTYKGADGIVKVLTEILKADLAE